MTRGLSFPNGDGWADDVCPRAPAPAPVPVADVGTAKGRLFRLVNMVLTRDAPRLVVTKLAIFGQEDGSMLICPLEVRQESAPRKLTVESDTWETWMAWARQDLKQDKRSSISRVLRRLARQAGWDAR